MNILNQLGKFVYFSHIKFVQDFLNIVTVFMKSLSFYMLKYFSGVNGKLKTVFFSIIIMMKGTAYFSFRI